MPGDLRINQWAIERYHRYFADQLQLIRSIRNHHYQKTLFVAVLDTFSRAAVPEKKSKNRERFVDFVQGWGGWPEAGRVSLPQLAGNLAGHPALADGRLAAAVQRRLDQWQPGRIYRATEDPPKDELAGFLSSKEEQQLLDGHTHLSLLWAYRNVLVHEFREPGYDMGVLGDDATPYYMSMDDERGDNRWELAYPTNFFIALCERSLVNLKRHFERHGLDPYAFYEFGSTWKRSTPG